MPNTEILMVAAVTLALLVGLVHLVNMVAPSIRLLDRAHLARKQDKGQVPLSGGIAIFLTLCLVCFFTDVDSRAIPYPFDFWPSMAVLLGMLVIVHAADDIFDFSAWTRLAFDSVLALLICTVGLLQINSLGALFGLGEVTLGRWAIPMTVFSLTAASNAFNMADGIDSLASGLGVVALLTVIGLLLSADSPNAMQALPLLTTLVVVMTTMYLINLGMLGPSLTSFLGDSGARLLGFMVGIALIYAAIRGYFEPVYAFFPIAIPVCDCLVLIGRRVRERRSPFDADRLHLHHLLMDRGLGERNTRRFILLLATLVAALGISLNQLQPPEWVVSVAVVLTFVAFALLRRYLERKPG